MEGERGRVGWFIFEQVVTEKTLLTYLTSRKSVSLWARLEEAQKWGLIRDLHDCREDEQC